MRSFIFCTVTHVEDLHAHPVESERRRAQQVGLEVLGADNESFFLHRTVRDQPFDNARELGREADEDQRIGNIEYRMGVGDLTWCLRPELVDTGQFRMCR